MKKFFGHFSRTSLDYIMENKMELVGVSFPFQWMKLKNAAVSDSFKESVYLANKSF